MASPRNLSFIQVANVSALILTLLINALSNILPLNGKTTAEISDLYPTLFTPAGYVFSIWSVIYLLLIAFAAYQALPEQREKTFLGKINYLFVLSSIANISWIFLWHYEQIVLSTLPMFVLLSSLILIYIRLQIGQSVVSLKEKLLVHVPFSVYLGWITVATIANVAAALTSVNWDGFGISDVIWCILVIIVALIITVVTIITRKDVAFSLVIIWALGGIVVKQLENQSIALTAGTSIFIIVIVLIAKILRSK